LEVPFSYFTNAGQLEFIWIFVLGLAQLSSTRPSPPWFGTGTWPPANCHSVCHASLPSLGAIGPKPRAAHVHRSMPPYPLRASQSKEKAEFASSSHSHLGPLLAQPRSTAPRSSGQRLPSHAPCIAAEGFPILGLPFAVGSARSAETPPPPTSSVGAAPSPSDSSHGTRPLTPPQAPPRPKCALRPPGQLPRPRVHAPAAEASPPSRPGPPSCGQLSPTSLRLLFCHHEGRIDVLILPNHESTTKPVPSPLFPIGRTRRRGEASQVSFQFHFCPKSLPCAIVVP
jgi:hypothetical protein